MRTSEAINELAAALAAAQGEMQNAVMSAENPHFKSRYADLAAIRNATIPALSKNGLSILQAMSSNSAEMLLTTRLMHSSGQWIESAYPIIFNERPHVMGSAITYAKRYSWSAITGIAAEVDDDGNEAQDAAKTNGTRSNPFFPDTKRKSSAQAKRDGDWPALEKALADCQSAREVERLREEWVRDVYPSWKDDWRDAATEAFDKRLADFSQPGSLKQTLKDSIEAIGSLDAAAPDPDETFHDCWKYLENAKTLTDLITRTDNPGFKEGLKLVSKAQWNQLKAFKAQRLEELGGIKE